MKIVDFWQPNDFITQKSSLNVHLGSFHIKKKHSTVEFSLLVPFCKKKSIIIAVLTYLKETCICLFMKKIYQSFHAKHHSDYLHLKSSGYQWGGQYVAKPEPQKQWDNLVKESVKQKLMKVGNFEKRIS